MLCSLPFFRWYPYVILLVFFFLSLLSFLSLVNSHKHVERGRQTERGSLSKSKGERIDDAHRAIIYPSCRPSNQSCRHMLK